MLLSHEQQKFLNVNGKVVLCACPGSGKTYVVAQKLINLINIWKEPHQGILTLSFTNVASEEILHQVHTASNNFTIGYPHFVGTIDSFLNNYIFLRYGHLLMENPKHPFITVDSINIPFRFWKKECHRNKCVESISQFRWGVDGNTYINKDLVTCDSGTYGRPCDQYKQSLKRNGIFFQNDIPFFCHEILSKYPAIGQAIVERFPIVLLDEAQDTSLEQMAVLDQLVKAGLKYIYLVGDPDQAIYEWRNATPECFKEKMHNMNWETKYLSENRRSSQKICNATHLFSNTFKDCSPNLAVGDCKNFAQKPELFLIKKETSKETILQYFLDRCECLGIPRKNENIAILTRSKVHDSTNISGLWKSKEILLLGRATYEWYHGSRKKAYDFCEQALYSILIDDINKATANIPEEIERIIPYTSWVECVFNLVCELPNSNLSLKVWVESLRTHLNSITYPLEFRAGHGINEIIQIKTRDKKSPLFKEIPFVDFFQKKLKTDVTFSSIHGVKGETFEAILLYSPSTKGNTITRKLLTNGELNSEQMRTAYVAMTRPKKYLAVALAKPTKKSDLPLPRFPYELWDYVEI